MLLFPAHFRNPSQPFRGFDAQDVKQSEKRLSISKIELCDIPLPEMDEAHVDSTNTVTEPVPNSVKECHDQTENADMNQSAEQKLIVGEILEEVVETIIRDDKARGDGEHNGEATADVTSQIGIESIPMPKDDPELPIIPMIADDPETAFFLSLS